MNHPTATPKEVIEVLNGLIEICRDGQQGFNDASENISQVSWKKFCLEQSLHRANYAGELQQHVQYLGGEPETTGSTTGSIHRAWINLKAGLGGGDEAIMSACETGEDAAVSLYKKALEKAAEKHGLSLGSLVANILDDYSSWLSDPKSK